MKKEIEKFDVIIVGGSYAGLSAAMALGRSLRKVLVIDAGKPCNAQTPHSHNFLTQDGSTPAAISSLAKQQVLQYPTVKFEQGSVTSGTRHDGLYVVDTEEGQTFAGRKLLLATGVKDVFPAIPGLKECWGISVLHCPYCHGYEVRNTNLGIIANGDMAIEFVKLILNWSKDLRLFTNGHSTMTKEHHDFLDSVNVKVIEHHIDRIVHENGQMKTVQLASGDAVDLNAVFTRLPFEHHTPVATQLGCALTQMNLIAIDELGKTNIPGVYAAGDITSPMRSVSNAVAGGTKAGAAINKELIEEAFAFG